MSEWQLIGTAPREGDTEVLLFVRWRDAHSKPLHPIWCWAFYVGYWDDGCWVNSSDDDTPFGLDLLATHWMPLPEPPE